MSTPENKAEENVTTENETTGLADAIKESRMTVNMTKETLYDFLLFHAYSKFSGFLVNILGLAIIFLGIFSYTTGKVNGAGAALYLAAAALFLGSTPIQLKMRAKKQVVINKEYNSPAEYTFSEAGIMIRQNGESRTYEWDHIESGSDTEDDWNLLCTGMCNDSSKTGFWRPVCTDIYHHCHTAWTE